MMRSTLRASLFAGVACSMIAMSCPALAQAADQAATADGNGDIVVTAQRRSERLVDVPLAVTAIGSDAVADRNIKSIENLAGAAPNLTVVQGYSATSVLAMRGGATINPSTSFEPTVGVYVDGVYIGKAAGSAFDISDIDHIDVLRGPQGTLYGRNTLSGAVNVTTRKPTGEFGFDGKVGIGNYEGRSARANLNLPAFGNIKIKLSGLLDRHEGYVENRANPFANVTTATPRTIARSDGANRKAARAAVRYQPSSDFTLDYTFDWSRTKVTPLNPQLTAVGAGNIFDPASPFYAGGLVGGSYFGFPLNLYVVPGGARNGAASYGYQTTAYLGTPPGEKSIVKTHALTGEWDVGPAMTLKSITSYRRMNYMNANDFDGSPMPILAMAVYTKYHQFSQELQASGKTGDFTYTAGAYYFSDKAKNLNPQQIFGTTLIDSRYNSGTKSYAGYGQVDYNPAGLEALTLTAGLRYSSERKSTYRFQQILGTPNIVAVPASNAHDTFSAFTPSFVAKYALSHDVNVYARYASGFKSGGYDGDALSVAEATRSYKPEKLKSYEIGFKSQLFDRKLQLNIAAFREKHDDLQLSIFLGASTSGVSTAIRNAGKATVDGLEIELYAHPSDWLTLQGGLGYLDAKYDRFEELGVNVAKQRAYPFAPKWTANASVDATVAKTSFGDLHAMVDYKHSGNFFLYAYSNDRTAVSNAYTTEAGGSDVFDGRIALKNIPLGNGSFEIAGWVKNITNERPRFFGIDFGPQLGSAVVSYYARPRTYGFELGFKY